MSRRRDDFDLSDLRTDPVPWNPGEHIAIIGTTGTGKSYLMSRIVQMRRFVAILRVKPDDIKFPGYKRTKDHRALVNLRVTDPIGRFLIEPEYHRQAIVGARLMESVWKSGGWTIVLDELFYVHMKLRLGPYVDMLATQGRSKRISLVTGMQRPVNVTRFALSEMTHIFTFRLEKRDVRTVAEIAGDDFANVSGRIPQYHFAHYHVPTRSIAVGTADRLDRVLSMTDRTQGP